ncbi:hypothetical protein QBC33DRAFT_534714 [Phialemonium atrogriseum]|uniref:Uncharacterized protein n=1 Tax=Phialemonium atrogriseum TaxID=1093897 RepID=A0AAJ0FPP6_9PEZI|nr:uncharacterized protein QBC33DRAFT_534714 [Phialemonium atrogriseum]KAK1768360.1 hypothetical protein QBC33DRAFT_534714 [Phialemonium atrogriseum]
MNVDEMLSDAPSSFSQDAAAGAGESGKVTGGGMNPKKLREEIELAKTRLSDQKFRITDYPDPLLPRKGISPKKYPAGVTAEIEERLMAVIAKTQATSNA